MVLSLIVIAIVGAIAYMWSARGAFSAFLHMLCVIVAGALAFAFWEPLAIAMLSGTDSPTLVDLGWGLALGMPFAIILLVLRVACDKLVPANLDFDQAFNVVGGLVFGAVSGTITAGILVMSVGYTRLETQIASFQPINFQPNGSVVREGGLLYPADRLTAWFYSTLSNSTLLPPDGRSLGRLRPQLADEHWMLRMNYEEGKSKSTITPGAFEVKGAYKVTPSGDPAQLLSDSFDAARKQTVTNVDGTPVDPAQSELFGYVVRFSAGAREESGRIVVGNAQLRLVVQPNPNDEFTTLAVHPFAMVSQAAGDKLTLGRWRFDAPRVFVSSVGGRDDAPMAFEFLVPKGSKPVALYVKGVRVDVDPEKIKPTEFASTRDRDTQISSGAITSVTGQTKFDRSAAVRVRSDPSVSESAIRVTNRLPYNIIVQKDTRKNLEIDEQRRINGGELSKFGKDDTAPFGTDQLLQVNQFSVSDDQQVVQVVVDGANTQFGFLVSAAAGASGRPVLVDNLGLEYSPTGYVYQKSGETWIYFNPGAPIQSLTDREMPTLSRSQPDQKLTLIFVVSKGVKIKEFGIGARILADFNPQIEVR
ncbi:MAG: CvpA family protein [Phycisphaerales bacterium]|nr:CvpA family protein [Phycisphaerales bacterium]